MICFETKELIAWFYNIIRVLLRKDTSVWKLRNIGELLAIVWAAITVNIVVTNFLIKSLKFLSSYIHAIYICFPFPISIQLEVDIFSESKSLLHSSDSYTVEPLWEKLQAQKIWRFEHTLKSNKGSKTFK